MRDHDIPVTENITLRLGDEPRNPFGYPCFVKPARLGSSVGITKAHDEAELQAGVRSHSSTTRRCSSSSFVAGIEVEVGVLGNLTPDRIAARRDRRHARTSGTTTRRSTTRARWTSSSRRASPTSRSSARRSSRCARSVATDCEGMARADLLRPRRRRGARERAEHDPRLHVDERLRAALRGVGDPVRRSARRGSPTSPSSASSAAASCATDEPPASARDAPPGALGGRRGRVRRAARAHAGGAGRSTYDLPQPKWWFLHHQIRRGFLVHGSNEPAIDEFRTRQNLDAHQRPIDAVFASDDAIWPLYFAVVNRPVAQSYINWCEHVTRAARTRATCSRSGQTRATRARGPTGRSTCCRARRSRHAREPRARQRAVPVRPARAAAGDAGRLPVPHGRRAGTGAATSVARRSSRGTRSGCLDFVELRLVVAAAEPGDPDHVVAVGTAAEARTSCRRRRSASDEITSGRGPWASRRRG